MKKLNQICNGSVTINPFVIMQAEIIKIGSRAIIRTLEKTIKCKDLQEAIILANTKGYVITNKESLPLFFQNQIIKN